MTDRGSLVAAMLVVASFGASGDGKPSCVAPAKPGGGFDVTCRMVQAMVRDASAGMVSLDISFIPGGIGAVAYNVIVSQRPREPDTLVAFSSGSLLNLAQGKFGRYSVDDVRWAAAIGADYGAIVVARNSPWRTLKDLEQALRRDPSKVVFGGGGTVGSQDWMKAAVTVRALGVDFKSLRFVAFEGGGEATKALRGNHIQVLAGDAAETVQQLGAGAEVRVLAVLAPHRLGGPLQAIPTAKEQGYDIEWRIVRGVYLGPKVPDEDYRRWVSLFRSAMTRPDYRQELEKRGMQPFSLTGPELEAFVKAEVAAYRTLAIQFGLQVPR